MENIYPQIIGDEESINGKETFKAKSPLTGAVLDANFCDASSEEIDKAASLAEKAFKIFKNISTEKRALFLEKIASLLEENSEQIIEVCMQESALPQARLEGEMGRTCNQLRMFATQICNDDFIPEIEEEVLPERVPPRPHFVRKYIAIGPVVLFGASNFPLAFSVAGGDTASALAAGCPVIAKGHPLHPHTSYLVGKCIQKAAKETNMPNGVFSLLQGKSYKVGEQLLSHTKVKAGAFTGSLNGGKALLKIASNRPEPIPFFAEMGSVNPVIIMSDALQKSYEDISAGLINSCTLDIGQFCTNPGLVILENTNVINEFLNRVKFVTDNTSSGHMLSEDISNSYDAGIKSLSDSGFIDIVAQAKKENIYAEGRPCVLKCEAKYLIKNPDYIEEVFGPSTLIVIAESKSEIIELLNTIGGQLTATLFCEKENLNKHDDLLELMSEKAGRVLFNSYPTGVEVGLSMQHGGPWPASTDSRFTSVGAQAIFRFLRPVVWQGFE